MRWLSLVLLLSCGKKDEPPRPDKGPQVEYLSEAEHLVRISMAVRGIRPTVEELDAVTTDPALMDAVVDAWLTSDEFGETLRDLHAELFLLRRDTTDQLPVKGILDDRGYDQDDVYLSTTEAPLRMVEHIVQSGRPYTEIVTADYAYADRVVADVYGLPFDPAGSEWQETRWVDGRPHAGLLSDSEIWRRHTSNAQNFHRGRANFISNTFLCENIGARDVIVEGGVALNDPFEVAHAVNNQASCVGCHQVLDPLAGLFWGYKEQLRRGAILEAYQLGCDWDWDNGEPPRGSYRIDHWCYPLRFYVVTDEDLWDFYELREPGYFGQPASDVTDLGEYMAADPRFAQCTARNFAGYLGQIDRMDVPLDVASDMQRILEQSGFDARELVKQIVLSEPWRIRRVLDDPDDEVFYVGLQTIRPEQYARTLYDLTGFRWMANQDPADCANSGNNCWNSVDLLDSDLYGFRSMQGGIDAYTVVHPTHTPTPTKVLTMQMAAAEAAGWVVEMDLQSAPSARRLLTRVDGPDTAEPAIREQLSWLHKRILGEMVAADSPEVDLTYDLWLSEHQRSGDVAEAWKLTVTALLQDPRMTFY